jgi:hypothetical protein
MTAKEEFEDIGKIILYNRRPAVYSKVDFLSKLNQKKIENKRYRNDIRKIKKGINIEYVNKPIDIFEHVKDEIIEVETVDLNISEGVIENIRVTAKELKSGNIRIFENISSIPLQNMDVAALKIFLYDVRERDYFLKINDFMYFLPDPGEFYLPDDISCTLNSKNIECKLYASVDLNSNIDIKVYSDFLSLFNKASNGLIQTEAKTKIIVNSITTESNFYFLNFIEPSVRYSRFDSKYSSVQIKDSSEPLLFSSKEELMLNQLSYLNLGLKVNLIRAKLFGSFSELNAGCSYDFVDIQLNNSSESIPINMFSYYIEDRGGVAKSKYFGLNYSLGVLIQSISFTGKSIISDTEVYTIPEIAAYFYPKGDSSKKLFLRFRSFANTLTRESFPLFQFGYSSKLGFNKN